MNQLALVILILDAAAMAVGAYLFGVSRERRKHIDWLIEHHRLLEGGRS